MISPELYQQGIRLGYTHEEVRKIISREEKFNLILQCNTVEDIKILLLHWVDIGVIK